MFNSDRWREILDTLWRNKLRSGLTALSMAWGIFMLVVLLGLGTGLQNGTSAGFAGDATNSIWMFAGLPSVPFDGMPVGRKIILANRDIDTVGAIKGIDHISGQFTLPGKDLSIRAGVKNGSYEVRAVYPDHLYLENLTITAGRFVNDIDISERRKVCAVGESVAQFMFSTKDVIGKRITISQVSFEIVGLFTDPGGAGETDRVYIPISTAQTAFNGSDHLGRVAFTVGNISSDESKVIAEDAKQRLAAAHRYSGSDPQAVRVHNNLEQFESFQQIFFMIQIFIWIMASGAIISGIVGVSNIMMIVVRERTKEIGVRKALGATPGNIVGSIVQEAVFLTSAAGYMGLVVGVGALLLIDKLVPANEMFAHPTVDFKVAITAIIVLVIAGAVAGLFPALAAAKVNPIVALRDE